MYSKVEFLICGCFKIDKYRMVQKTKLWWFKNNLFRQNAETAGVYGSQSSDDFDRDDVEQLKGSLGVTYFNYMGMLAVEGTYDKMEALLSQNIHPVDILLLMASTEGDLPKIEELLRAEADYTVKDADEIKDFIVNFKAQKDLPSIPKQTKNDELIATGVRPKEVGESSHLNSSCQPTNGNQALKMIQKNLMHDESTQQHEVLVNHRRKVPEKPSIDTGNRCDRYTRAMHVLRD
ncbi:hypothetical protein RND71_015249 [Anisodus tanguticus]|uniref:Uncharacterized protein n=1 Tax=Anisodus tanguticus TaxID=243964 RepID=A0AAE1S7K6_9SOLA|nr:hypothetical protein RND71_015249 [Anisodus tanguticus]